MQNYVFTLDSNRNVLDPCHPAVARKLQTQGRAKQIRRYPMTIILNKEVENPNPQPLTLKIDPGSKFTGFALLNAKNEVIWAMELEHRGMAISASLLKRSSVRRNRRNRKTRYRKARFLNRARPEGWLAPSLMHRVLTIETWVKRICRYANVTKIVMELVRFDLQKMENPEISGVEYQQGALAGYEVREYLLEKWGRQCAYCGKQDTPLEIEHIQPKSKGGSDRISNLTLACNPCNQKKGAQDVEDFLSGKTDLLKRILSQAKAPLKDAAAVNSIRWKLLETLKTTGLPVGTGSGGQTKYNRIRLGLPKEHWIDAACVGEVESVVLKTTQPLRVKCHGHGDRQMVQVDSIGFPRKGYKAKQKVNGWSTGDIVSVVAGKHAGLRGKRLKTVRSRGQFDIRLSPKVVIGVSRKHIKAVHRNDGYSYSFG